MKKCILIAMAGMIMLSCGNGATDQDAKTDTTNMPPTMPNQDSNQINRSYGTQTVDSNGKDSLR